MSLLSTIGLYAGSYLGIMLAALYVPAFFPKLYDKLNSRFNATTLDRPPYELAMILWPISFTCIAMYYLFSLLKYLPHPNDIATWMKERQQREQLRRENTLIGICKNGCCGVSLVQGFLCSKR